jgi:flavorubredoxin
VEITKFLKGLAQGVFSGKQAAAFDTQIQMAISGNAAKGIEKKLKNLGFTIIKEPLVVYVKGEGKNIWQFKPGELEKAKTWAQEIAKTLS